jgi:hypothetical protein
MELNFVLPSPAQRLVLQRPPWPQLVAALTDVARAALENVGLQEDCTCTL